MRTKAKSAVYKKYPDVVLTPNCPVCIGLPCLTFSQFSYAIYSLNSLENFLGEKSTVLILKDSRVTKNWWLSDRVDSTAQVPALVAIVPIGLTHRQRPLLPTQQTTSATMTEESQAHKCKILISVLLFCCHCQGENVYNDQSSINKNKDTISQEVLLLKGTLLEARITKRTLCFQSNNLPGERASTHITRAVMRQNNTESGSFQSSHWG